MVIEPRRRGEQNPAYRLSALTFYVNDLLTFRLLRSRSAGDILSPGPSGDICKQKNGLSDTREST